MSDDGVVARAKDGDPEAWRELYRAHAGRLVAWLSTRPSGDSAASHEDLAAEAWLIAAEKVHTFEGTSSEFAGWLFGIARNLGSNARRRSLRRRTDPSTIEDHAVGWPSPTPDPTLVLSGNDWVRQALSGLPPRERDVVGLVDALGLDISAAARALGISAVAVRVSRHRGLHRLRAARTAHRESAGVIPDGPLALTPPE